MADAAWPELLEKLWVTAPALFLKIGIFYGHAVDVVVSFALVEKRDPLFSEWVFWEIL